MIDTKICSRCCLGGKQISACRNFNKQAVYHVSYFISVDLSCYLLTAYLLIMMLGNANPNIPINSAKKMQISARKIKKNRQT